MKYVGMRAAKKYYIKYHIHSLSLFFISNI